METQELVELSAEVFERIQNSRSNSLAVFVDGNQIKIQKPDSVRFQQVFDDFPSAVVGVYTRQIPYPSLVADLWVTYKELGWLS